MPPERTLRRDFCIGAVVFALLAVLSLVVLGTRARVDVAWSSAPLPGAYATLPPPVDGAVTTVGSASPASGPGASVSPAVANPASTPAEVADAGRRVATVMRDYRGVEFRRDRRTGTLTLVVDPFPEASPPAPEKRTVTKRKR